MHESSHKKLLNDVAYVLALTAPADDVRASTCVLMPTTRV